METAVYETYRPVVRGLTAAALSAAAPPAELLMERDEPFSIYYAPFDAINHDARVVLVGITPGRRQMDDALRVASRCLAEGSSDEEALRRAKEVASFAGPMRSNLVAMLDYFRMDEALGIQSCSELFGDSCGLVHFTSALRYPVFHQGRNYSGSPSMTRNPLLAKHLMRYFAAELEALPHALVVPLGQKVSEAIRYVAERSDIGSDRVLHGLQHPSGANNERIGYLMERKSREALSRQVRPDRIDRDRADLRAKMQRLLDG